MPAKLSVNVNKYALVRNSRGHDAPNLQWAADLCIAAGAHGITVHPRGDQRHVRFEDVPVMAAHLRAHHPQIELNVECEAAPQILELVLAVKPAQCTLVPVTPGEVTSDHGYRSGDVESLVPVVARLHAAGIRVSLFVDCEPEQVRALARTGADRVELYTGPYAHSFGTPDEAAQTRAVYESAKAAREVGLGLNAGHDLDRVNLHGLRELVGLCEVSIGHAHICRALEVGTAQSVRELLLALGHPVVPSLTSPRPSIDQASES
ncbi:MAG: Pyridoxine 5-phosphate synthase [Myxococcaceae bacterium]|nr:Pyridoxine 5-phosphate synthase [Myxococcaceae bacterium]